jgi:hypothetical protein
MICGGGRPTYLACSPWRGVCFQGPSSSAASTQETESEDNRVGADSGAIVAQGGSTVIEQNEDIAAVTASLAAAQSIANTATISAAGIDTQAVTSTAGIAGQAISASEADLSNALGLASTAISAVSGLAANDTVLAENAVAATQPEASALKSIVVAAVIVAVVYFFTRAK